MQVGRFEVKDNITIGDIGDDFFDLISGDMAELYRRLIRVGVLLDGEPLGDRYHDLTPGEFTKIMPLVTKAAGVSGDEGND